MKRYRVIVTPDAADRIASCASYIAHHSGSDEIARNWLLQVYSAVEELDHLPHRCELAEEDVYHASEIRRLIIGNYLALFTIDDEDSVVRVVGFRHAARLPRANDL